MKTLLEPEEKELLEEIQVKLDPDAVIGGEVIRDRYFGNSYLDKEINIFLNVTNPKIEKLGWGYVIDECIADIFGSDINIVEIPEKSLLSFAKPKISPCIIEAKLNNIKFRFNFISNIQTFYKNLYFNCNAINTNGTTIHRAITFKKFESELMLVPTHTMNSFLFEKAKKLKLKYPHWNFGLSINNYIKQNLESMDNL